MSLTVQRLQEIDNAVQRYEIEKEALIRDLTAQSKCAKCQWISNPKGGVIPACRDLDNHNYAKRITTITYCKRFPKKSAVAADGTQP